MGKLVSLPALNTDFITDMRNMLKLSVAAMILAAAVSCSKEPAVVAVDGGLVQGVASAARGITVFKGIPYAAPPVDSLRWREPQPVIPWEGVKKADTFGRIPWQEDLSTMDLYGKEFYSDGMPEMSEDCLYLNIWAPTKTVADPQAKLPVALWIHGGAFYHGFSNEITFDGDEWAGRGVILVTINYREGVFGFLAHDLLAAEPGAEGRSGNYALYDQLAALEWVNRNIASFGGDPENVTVFGQSAGARSVQTLVSNPNMTGSLISKAIIQSGGGISTSQQTSSVSYVQARAAGAEFCEFAGYETLEQMKAAPAEEIMQKYVDYQAQGEKIPLGPMSDFNLVGNSFTSATALNQILDIPYMIGYTTKDGERKGVDINEFCAARCYYSDQPVFQYKFTREMPGDDAGAFHSAELWYMFGTLGRCWRPFVEADYDLSRDMLDAWTNFCKFGDPCGETPSDFWPAFTSSNPYRKIWDIE